MQTQSNRTYGTQQNSAVNCNRDQDSTNNLIFYLKKQEKEKQMNPKSVELKTKEQGAYKQNGNQKENIRS